MTQTTLFATNHRPIHNSGNDDDLLEKSPSSSTTTCMRLIVPLQGIVQGRCGLILGLVILYTMFYFPQFYLKRRRSPLSRDCTSDPPSSTELSRSALRSNLLLLCGSIFRQHVSAMVCLIAKANYSCYYVGLDSVSEDPYDRLTNLNGVVQLGLAENWV